MSDEPDDDATDTGGGDVEKKKRGRPRGSGTGQRGRPPTARFDRRAKKAEETVKELLRLRLPELDVSNLSFAETVDRDSDAWGAFLAQLGEWVTPFGTFLDLIFGAALVRVLRMAPSVRAARRDFEIRSAERRAIRAAERETEERLQASDDDRDTAAETGVFADQPANGVTPAGYATREEWLAAGGAG